METEETKYWRTQQFIDLFAGAYTEEAGKCSSYGALDSSFSFVIQTLEETVTRAADDPFTQCLAKGLRFGQSILKKMAACEKNDSKFLEVLNLVSSELKSLSEGDVLVIPGGWRSTSQMHLVLYVVSRKDSSTFTFSICNNSNNDLIDSGMQYHPSKADPVGVKTKYVTSIKLDTVPLEKITDSWIWFMLLRMLAYPSAENTPKMLYEKLLPFLNSCPLKSNLVEAELEFRSLPHNKDSSKIKLVMEAVFHSARLAGHSALDAKQFGLMIRMGAIVHCHSKLIKEQQFSTSDGILVRFGCKGLATAAAKYGQRNPKASADMLNQVQELIDRLEGFLQTMYEKDDAFPPTLDLGSWDKRDEEEGNATFLAFDRLRRDVDVERFAGQTALPPLIRPVELTKVPDSVGNFAELTKALKYAIELCTVLDNQSSDLKNTYCLRVALIHHLFTRVIPIPLACNYPDYQTKCFWRREPIRYETQHLILKQVHHLTMHYVAASFAIFPDSTFDAARLTTMVSIAAVTDVLLRLKSTDLQCDFVMHYNAWLDGPIQPFGFDVGAYAAESEWSVMVHPHLMAARSKCLAYFAAQRALIADDHILFNFESTLGMGPAEEALMDQLALMKGFRRDLLPQYLTGENPAMLHSFPELQLFRDIVFLFKAVLVPYSDKLPEIKRWKPEDASLFWKWTEPGILTKDKEKAHFTVAGFEKTELQCSGFVGSGEQRKGLIKRMVAAIKTVKPRIPPTQANPSVLLGEEVNSERTFYT